MTITFDALPTAALPEPRSAWGSVASLCLHVALIALLLFGPNLQRPPPPVPKNIAVDMIPAAQFAALLERSQPQPPSPAPPATEAVAPPVGAAPEAGPESSGDRLQSETIRATEFYASGLLAEPASAKLRAAMGTLAGSERIVQLCDIEAMEQIRRARPEFDPDMVVAYAMAEMAIRDGALIADGAAFRSRREWYGVKFTCTAAADFSGVEAFAFTLGTFIPHELWDAHFLTAEEADE